jgi:hypothetical protein
MHNVIPVLGDSANSRSLPKLCEETCVLSFVRYHEEEGFHSFELTRYLRSFLASCPLTRHKYSLARITSNKISQIDLDSLLSHS